MEPILLAIAIASILILSVALAGIKLMESWSRWLGFAFVGLLLALLSGRVAPSMLSGTFQRDSSIAVERALDKVTVTPAQTAWNNLTTRIDPAYAATGYLPIRPDSRTDSRLSRDAQNSSPERSILPPVRSPNPATAPTAAPTPAPTIAPTPVNRAVNYSPANNPSPSRDPVKGLW